MKKSQEEQGIRKSEYLLYSFIFLFHLNCIIEGYFLILLSFASLVCTFALFICKCLTFTVFYYSIKHSRLPLCMKCATEIKLWCLSYSEVEPGVIFYLPVIDHLIYAAQFKSKCHPRGSHLGELYTVVN